MRQLLKWVLLSYLFTFALSAQSVADMLSDAKLLDAKRAYFTGDFERAEKLVRHMAEQGNGSAQNILGVMYFNGQGVAQDFQEAARLYLLSATQGNAIAQNNLGLLYEDGQGVIQDYQEAAKWYRQAAEQGYAFAQNNLGLLYRRGKG
ncbi:MAG: tetratricopeptide repeat protein, partial [Nitrosomonadaceae bacterium]